MEGEESVEHLVYPWVGFSNVGSEFKESRQYRPRVGMRIDQAVDRLTLLRQRIYPLTRVVTCSYASGLLLTLSPSRWHLQVGSRLSDSTDTMATR